jgi:hypothetical protein
MSSFSSSSLLVSVQLSVFSSWRFAHTAKIARNARKVATEMRISGSVRRRPLSELIRQPKPGGVLRAMACAGVAHTGLPPQL